MEKDIKAVSTLSYVDNVELEGIMLVVIFTDGEDVTIYAPDYPTGEATAEIRGSTHVLTPGKVIDYVRQSRDILLAQPAMGTPQASWTVGPVEPCAAFKRDIDEMKSLFGESSVWYTKIDSFSDNVYRASVELKLDPMPLMSGPTAECFKVDRKQPIVIRLTISDASTYGDMRDTKIEVFQAKRACALAAQIQRILQHPGRLVSIWEITDKPVGKTVKAEPLGFTRQPEPRRKGPKELSKAKRDLKKALIGMGFDEKMAHSAAALSDSVEQAAQLIMDHPEALHYDDDEGEVETEVDRTSYDHQKAMIANLTSGVNVIPKDEEDPNKAVPIRTHGFFVQLVQYCINRIRTCSSYCVICDQPHLFSSGAMMKPAVCSRELCAFSFHALGVGSEAAEEIATDTGVIDLLVVMLKAAAFSTRAEAILNPYPQVVDPNNPKKLAFDPKSRDIPKIQATLENFPSVRSLSQANDIGDIKRKLDIIHPLAYSLMQWCVGSNRSHIVKLKNEDHLKSMQTPHQYMLLTAAPEKQKKFDELKAKHGSKFAFHGSNIENWHCILREGLKNASGTSLQLNGAAHGSGIYFACEAATSFGYSRSYELTKGGDQGLKIPELQGKFINERNMVCLALCEIIDLHIKDHGWCWTLEQQDECQTRFFFVYDGGDTSKAQSASTKSDAFLREIKEAVRKQGL